MGSNATNTIIIADLQREGKHSQAALQCAQYVLEVGPFSVQLVHKRDRRGVVFLGRSPNRFWLVGNVEGTGLRTRAVRSVIV